MNTTMTLSEIMKVEKTISEMMHQIRQQLIADVKEIQVPGVRKLSENTFVIRLSTLKQHDTWSPEYYNNVNQADRRDSGVTNMYGAVPYLVEKFGLSMSEATNVLVRWMESYQDRYYY